MKTKVKAKTIQPIVVILAILVFVSTVLGVSKFLLQRNNAIKSNTGQSSSPNLTSTEDESWTISKVNKLYKSHYLAYFKTSDQDVRLYNIDTSSEFTAFQKIDKTLFCTEGCLTRSFSFSPDGKKLIADLLVSNNRVGFGYISLDKITSDKEIHFIREGYNPFSNFDGSIIFFYDKPYSPRTLSYIDMNDNKVVSVGEFIPIDWLSINELLLDSDKVQKESGTFYKYNVSGGSFNKIVVKDLFTKGKDVFPVSVSPLKNKVLVKTYDGHAKLGIVDSNGIGYKQVGSEDSPLGAWSPDGKMIAIQDISIYPTTLPSYIHIVNMSDFSIKKSINLEFGYSSVLCWLPNIQGDLIIVATKNNEIALYNLKSDVTKSIKSDRNTEGYFACY